MAPEGAPVHVLQDVPNTCNVKSSPNLSLTFLSVQDLFLETHGVKLGFMSAFVKASADALLKVPAVNAVIDGDEIIYRDYTDVSIAVATPKGLVVPVLRNVDSLSFAEVEKVRARWCFWPQVLPTLCNLPTVHAKPARCGWAAACTCQ